MPKITFLRENICVEAPEGSILLNVMRDAGLHPDAPCGGQGRCGKCRVLLDGETEALSCLTPVDGDMTVDTGAAGDGGSVILTYAAGEIVRSFSLNPLLEERKVRMRPCPAGESVSDWDRLAEGLREADPEAGSRDDFKPVLASMAGPLSRKTRGEFMAVLFGGETLDIYEQPGKLYMAAIDLGTTTIAACLLDAKTGAEVSVKSCMNPQAQYGADVISRANHSLEQGMGELTGCVREALNGLLREMAEEAGTGTDRIYAVCVAGNTCMHHMLLGISVDSLVHAPYNPALSGPLVLKASDHGLEAHPRAKLLMLPNIAGFVGADTTACLTATGLDRQEQWTLLVDIGTNGEMVLGNRDRMIACSTAAGPAFEGAGISCGMRGIPGAVSRVRWARDHWEYETIGNRPPRGICGSGLLDLAAQLLESGQMDETGELEDGPVITLAGEEETKGAPVTVTQKDIRSLQLAKAAIASGVYLLAKKAGIEIKDIRQVWLAGAFGSFLSPESACRIGLLPPELEGRISTIGNAALEGAKQALLDRDKWIYAAETAGKTGFLELASMPEFQDLFVDELLFPDPEEA